MHTHHLTSLEFMQIIRRSEPKLLGLQNKKERPPAPDLTPSLPPLRPPSTLPAALIG